MPKPRQSRPQRYLWSEDYLHMRPLLKDVRQSGRYVTGRVLDVGCGNKPYRPWFNLASSYIGLDISAQRSQPDVIGLGTCLPFEDQSFDSVVAFQVLEHVPEPFAFVREVHRVLRPNGHFVATAPQAWRIHEAPHDYFRYTKFGLRTMLQRGGLEVLALRAEGGVWALTGQIVLNSIPHWRLFYLTTPLILMINGIFSLLDWVWHDEKDTLNYWTLSRRAQEAEGPAAQ
jgi:SAM-dependent methyltransferase